MRAIILKSTLAGPDGTLHPGKHSVAKGLAADLVAGRHAEYADARPKVDELVQPEETETIKPAEKRGGKK